MTTIQNEQIQRTRDLIAAENGAITQDYRENMNAILDAVERSAERPLTIDEHAERNAAAILALGLCQIRLAIALPQTVTRAIKDHVEKTPARFSWDVRDMAGWLCRNPVVQKIAFVVIVALAAYVPRASLPPPVARVEPVAAVLAEKTVQTADALAAKTATTDEANARDRLVIKNEIIAAVKAAMADMAKGDGENP